MNYVIGYAFSLIIGRLVEPLVTALHCAVEDKRQPDQRQAERVLWIPKWIGITERMLVTTLVGFGVPGAAGFAGAWVAVKAAGGWAKLNEGTTYGRSIYFVGLIGSSTSILVGTLGGLIVQKGAAYANALSGPGGSPSSPEWSMKALGTTWWSWPPNDLPMFWATIVAASVALWYVIVTSKLLKATQQGVANAWKANQSGLLKQVLEEYANLSTDVHAVHEWWRASPTTAIDRYEQGLRAPSLPTVAAEMGDSRRRISQYFLRLRALCEKEMLDPELVAATLGDEAVQVFLLYIDPLDEVVRRVAGKEPKTAEREYFRRYLSRHFPENTAGDPWGFRRPAA